MIEVIWHGRGGQGAWTASELLARAAIMEGKYVQSFPEFGPERMGAPVRAFTRISDSPITIHSAIYSPDIVVILDPTLTKTVNVTSGLKEDGCIILNSRGSPEEAKKELKAEEFKVYTVPATDISVEIFGREVTNTVLLGALARVSEIVRLDSIKAVLLERFPGKIGELNVKMVEKAYGEVKGVE